MIIIRASYSSCSELPLYNFIKIVVTGDKEYLYSQPKKIFNRDIDLNPIWDEIFEEYSSITKDTKSQHIFSLVRDIAFMNNNLIIIQEAVNLLSKTYDSRLCDMLRSMGFMYQFKNDDSLFKDLKLTIASAKRIVIQKQEAEKELLTFNKNKVDPTEKEYNDLITQLSKFMKFRIDSRQTSVTEFVSYVQAFNADNKPNNNGK